MLDEIRRVNSDTRVQYALMLLFGSLCIVAAFAPLEETIRIATVASLFGFTAGLWVSHLILVLRRVANRRTSGVTGVD